MSRAVRLTPGAQADLSRLTNFLAWKNLRAARAAAKAINEGLASLAESAERGRLAFPNHRELTIRFGRDGYVAQYRVAAHAVLVARIFHARERR